MEEKSISNISYNIQNQFPNNFDDVEYVGKQVVESSQSNDVELSTKKEPVFGGNETNDKYVSIELPSGFIFYDFDTLKIRKFEIRDLAKLAKVQKSESYKLFKDVIQGCIDRDVNALTQGDFRYLCYWLRLNSYPKSPMNIEWVSKYGNKGVAQVRKDNLITLAPDITKEQLQEWRAKGFEVPFLKFSDIFDTKLSDDDDYLYTNAQYFKGNTWEEKIATMEKYLNENGLESLQDIQTFDKLIEHGVQEEVTVYDSKFDPLEYKKKLEEQMKKIKLVLNNVVKPEQEKAALLGVMLDQLQTEHAQLTKRLAEGEVVQAEPETLFLEMDADELLSPTLA